MQGMVDARESIITLRGSDRPQNPVVTITAVVPKSLRGPQCHMCLANRDIVKSCVSNYNDRAREIHCS